ncbi:alpha-2Da adrenergic receptor-like [Stylophora pistillata]|uniref:alpha-2Da adrenergic receptor-like n=1 Tax=Stylophora pistillata TaxID=50429 RepID=UPI000C039587|nr:alpha-2Da adrenergic receptor-like [Stylophora pistillata]
MSGNFTNFCCTDLATSENFSLVTSTWPTSVVVLTAIIMIAINLATIVGNALVTVALVKMNALKVIPANKDAIVSLAVADLFVGLLVMPCAIGSVVAGKWRFGRVWGKLTAFGNFLFCISSIMHLTLLSVDRYVAISRPLVYSSVVTKNRVRGACLLLWIYSTLWALPPLFGVVTYECFIPYIGKCFETEWPRGKGAVWFTASVVCCTYGAAVLVMCCVHFKIFNIVANQSRRISVELKKFRANNGLETRTNVASGRKGALTILIAIGTYVVCWSPFCLLLIVQTAHGKATGGPTVDITTMFIGFANSACNPLIYSIRYKSFRIAVKRMFARSNYYIKNLFWSGISNA